MDSPLQDRVFRALADPTRRGILTLLGEDPRSVGELKQGLAISQPAVSQHLKLLREAGLVSERREGRRRIYALDAEPLALARQWLDRHTDFWASRLDNLGAHLRRKHGPHA
jgi:DNA-binding transcriptional ArsR family regulator